MAKITGLDATDKMVAATLAAARATLGNCGYTHEFIDIYAEMEKDLFALRQRQEDERSTSGMKVWGEVSKD